MSAVVTRWVYTMIYMSAWFGYNTSDSSRDMLLKKISVTYVSLV